MSKTERARVPAQRGLATFAALAALLVLAVACGPFVDEPATQLRADEIAGVLGDNHIVGERFAVDCADLATVDVQVAIYPDVPAGDGQLILTVDDASPETPPPGHLAEADFAIASLTPNEWLQVPVTTSGSPPGGAFRLNARSTARGVSRATLWATSHAASPSVARFVGADRVPGALVLRPSCELTAATVARQAFDLVGRSSLLWPIELLLCLVPGLAVAARLSPARRDPALFLGLAAGWRVLLAPLALAVGTPLRLGVVFVAVLLVLSGGSLAVGGLRITSHTGDTHRRLKDSPTGPSGLGWRWGSVRRRANAPNLALAATAGAVVVRLITARDLVVPMWVDSVQHSYIVSLLLDTGGVPATYGEAAPGQSFDYHFGFHALAAAGAWLSGASPAEAVLATGQILSALTPLAAYALARLLVQSRRAGAIAAVALAVVTTQPTYFVTWGRYPELAGLIALPAAFAALRLARKTTWGWQEVLIGILALTGIVLVHPRVAVFLACLVLAAALVDAVTAPRTRATVWRQAAIALGALTLLSPWLTRLWLAHRDTFGASLPWQPIDFPIGEATVGPDGYVLAAAALGVVIAVIQRRPVGGIAVLWSALVLVAANPGAFFLPVLPWINNNSVAIALFLPASVFAGYALATLLRAARFDAWHRPLRLAGGLLAITVALTQTPSLLRVVNPCCVLANPADLAAIDWVRGNTPVDARFLVNGFEWSPGTWAGTDAGYWLPVLAPRGTSLPPLFYATGPRTTRERTNQIAADIVEAADRPSDLAKIARQIGATFVFVGTRGGPIDPGRLADSQEFRLVYGRDGAWVFAVAASPGADSRSTVTEMTPVDSGTPSEVNAAGLRSTTSG